MKKGIELYQDQRIETKNCKYVDQFCLKVEESFKTILAKEFLDDLDFIVKWSDSLLVFLQFGTECKKKKKFLPTSMGSFE